MRVISSLAENQLAFQEGLIFATPKCFLIHNKIY